MKSKSGQRTSLAAKEKDAMQIGVMALCLAARLHRQERSWAAFYLDLLEQYDVTWRFYERRDITLFDEALKGTARDEAKEAGNRLKEATVATFAALEDRDPADVTRELLDRLPAGTELPAVQRCFHAGDGTFLELEGIWFELRASGTDAVLRYYMEGEDQAKVAGLNKSFTEMRIDNN